MLNTGKRFATIREVARMGIIGEYYLRQMVARGECPGIYSGNRFLVNVEKLVAKLDAISETGKDNKMEENEC